MDRNDDELTSRTQKGTPAIILICDKTTVSVKEKENDIDLPEVNLVGSLYDTGGRIPLFPLGRRRNDFQLASIRKLFLEFLVHLFLKLYITIWKSISFF